MKLYWHWSRGKALAVLIPIQLLIALPSMASSDFLQWNDRIWGSTMQPIGSALALVALGWSLQAVRRSPRSIAGARWPSVLSGFSGSGGSSPPPSSSSSSPDGGRNRIAE